MWNQPGVAAINQGNLTSYKDHICFLESLIQPVSADSFFNVDWIQAYISMLILLGKLQKEVLLLDYLENELEHRRYNYTIPSVNKYGHINIIWNNNEIYSTQQS